MGVNLFRQPALKDPTLVACWPGIGNIGIIAIETLKDLLQAEEFGEIEPWEFFYPQRVAIKHGVLTEFEFPANKFYFKKQDGADLLIFIGEEQPAEAGKAYAEGAKAFRLANLVLDVAVSFHCRRVYTSGAAVAPVHHSTRPRVWAVPNRSEIIPELKKYHNTLLMSEVEGRGGQGNITGLNGLLLGAAQKRGLEAVCLMGEIPVYLQGFPVPYPKASKSVLEVLSEALNIPLDLTGMDSLVSRNEIEIARLFESFPEEIRLQIDKLKSLSAAELAQPITEEDKKSIMEGIDRFLNKTEEE